MGNAYREFLNPKKDKTANDLLKKRDNPLLDFVETNDIKDYVVFECSRAMEIFLHSKEYKILGHCWESPDPYWASKDFQFEHTSQETEEEITETKELKE